MDYDEDENRPLGDFGSLLGVPAAADAEELALNEQLDLTGAAARAWLVKVCLTLPQAFSHCNEEPSYITVLVSAIPLHPSFSISRFTLKAAKLLARAMDLCAERRARDRENPTL